MIKHAEVQNAYLLGRQAALIKLAEDKDKKSKSKKDDSLPGTKFLKERLREQADIANLVGLTDKALTRNRARSESEVGKARYKEDQGFFENLVTPENIARAGILSGLGIGTYMGDGGPRSAGLASGGAIAGAQLGGNIGSAISKARKAYVYGDKAPSDPLAEDQLHNDFISYGGGLGGIGGGILAGTKL